MSTNYFPWLSQSGVKQIEEGPASEGLQLTLEQIEIDAKLPQYLRKWTRLGDDGRRLPPDEETAALRADWSKMTGKPLPVQPSPMIGRASDALALAVFDWIERGIIQTRTQVSDALEAWADSRFDVIDGTGIQKLREFAKSKGAE